MSKAKLMHMLGFDGVLVEHVQFAGLRFDAVVRPDRTEVTRRASVRLGPVLDRDVLEALFTLPFMGNIPIRELDPIVAAFLTAAPPGIVDIQGSRIERLWRPAVSVAGVVVSHTSWQRGLEAASLFAPDAPRALHLRVRPRALLRARQDAEELGIGLVLGVGDEEPEIVVPPSLTRRGAPSPRHWRFLETVFATWKAGPDYRLAQAVS
jgi:hypothetical protein